MEMDETESDLVKSADVSNITEGLIDSHSMWSTYAVSLSAPNVEHMDTDDSADELPAFPHEVPANDARCTPKPPSVPLSRQPSFVRVPSASDSLWATFLDEES